MAVLTRDKPSNFLVSFASQDVQNSPAADIAKLRFPS